MDRRALGYSDYSAAHIFVKLIRFVIAFKTGIIFVAVA